MSLIDIITILVLALAAFNGFSRGLVSQLGSLGGLIAGVAASRLLGPAAAAAVAAVSGHGTAGPADTIVGYVIVMAAVYIAVRLLARMAHSLTHTLRLGAVDHLAGAALTLLVWGFGLSIVLNLWQAVTSTPPAQSSRLADGRIVEAVTALAPAAMGACATDDDDDSPSSDDTENER